MPLTKCETCEATFPEAVVEFEGKVVCKKRYCEKCVELHINEGSRRLAGEVTFEERWTQLCPKRYAQEFNIMTLIASHPGSEKAIREAVAKTLAWPYSDRGIGLVGISGKGKTRIMFQLIKRYLREGRHCEYINLSTFGREVGARFSESASKANDWIKRLCRADVLFMDDVGKEKMTERVEVELYGIVETRSADMLPVFFTANSKGDQLIQKMRDDSGEISDRAMPIVRRLREFSEGITI